MYDIHPTITNPGEEKKLPKYTVGYTENNPRLKDVLFLDTEWDPVTKIPQTIQLRMNGEEVIINLAENQDRKVLKEWMGKAERVVFWNALGDMGLLSSLPGNSWEWQTERDGGGKWRLNIEGHRYDVCRIGVGYNYIKSYGRAPPILDVMKYWRIMVSNTSFALKNVYEEMTGKKAIHYTPENALTYDYQIQDVRILEIAYLIFFGEIKDIPEVAEYTAYDWQGICTPASFAKNEYVKVYGEETLKVWQKYNHEQDNKYKLRGPLEQAYNGGITMACYHGVLANAAIYDVNGLYAHVMMYENTDQYKRYEWVEIDPCQPLAREKHPIFCKVETNTVMDKIQNSLKIYRTKVKSTRWMWSYDILAMRLIHPDTEITIVQAFKPVPKNEVGESLPKQWSDRRDRLGKAKKSTYGLFLKFLSNTSYGICAQRKPRQTIHTNMVISGIITSRAHLALCEMVDEARVAGCRWCYSDTDSICVDLCGVDPVCVDRKLNERIAPYTCECELVGEFFILALKRYIAEGVDDAGNPARKVTIHGKSTYNIGKDDVYKMVKGEIICDDLIIKQTTANTPLGLKICVNRDPRIKHEFPFMFIKDIPVIEETSDGCLRQKTVMDWYRNWHLHMDTKTTVPPGVKFRDNFERELRVFHDVRSAHLYYGAMAKGKNELDADDINSGSFVDWDGLLRSQYGDALIDKVMRENNL